MIKTNDYYMYMRLLPLSLRGTKQSGGVAAQQTGRVTFSQPSKPYSHPQQKPSQNNSLH